jgi:CBS domain-containing protein
VPHPEHDEATPTEEEVAMMSTARPDEPVTRLVRRGPVTVAPTVTLRELSEVLVREEVGVALVTSSDTAVGLVSERDLVRAVADGHDVDDDRVEDVMTFELVAIDPHELIGEAAERMLDGEIRHLLVSDGEHSLGVISIRDVLSAHRAA